MLLNIVNFVRWYMVLWLDFKKKKLLDSSWSVYENKRLCLIDYSILLIVVKAK